MAYIKDLPLPRVGQALESAQITHLNVEQGHTFDQGDVLLEIDTDKSVIEVPAPEPGTLVEWRVAVHDMVEPDTVIARVEVAGEPPEALEESEEDATSCDTAEEPTVPETAAPPDTPTVATTPTPPGERIFATPAARRRARQADVDIATLAGSGPSGRIIKRDIEAATRDDRPDNDPLGAGAPPSMAGVDRDIATAHGHIRARLFTPTVTRAETTIILIHGLFGDMDVWSATARMAARAGLRVVSVDLPYHGASGSTATAIDTIIEAVEQTLAQITTGPLALVGHSLGGAIAARLTASPALTVRSLTLLAPLGLGTEINQAFLDGMVNATTIDALKRESRKLSRSGAVPSTEFLEQLLHHHRQRAEPLRTLCDHISHRGAQQLDITPSLESLDCPTTLVHGRDDTIIPWHHALNAPPHTALHLIPNVGHMPQWEAASLVNMVIQRIAMVST